MNSNQKSASARLQAAIGLALLAGGVSGFAADTNAPALETPGQFRLGVSYASFGVMNRNDASAALKVWASTVVKERKLDVSAQVEVFDAEGELRDALARNAVDAVSMTAEEFVRSGQQPTEIFLAAKEQGFAEQYVIVVRRRDGIEYLPALKGRKLVRHMSPGMSPALPWLETELAGRGLERVDKLLSEVLPLENASKAVLRVFFRQSDACLVTTNTFALACELNPQLGKDLNVLAVSPPLISSLFFFRPGYAAAARGELERAIVDLHSSPAGQQVLTVYQSSRMERQPLSSFAPTRQLLEQYQRLKQDASAAAAKLPATAALRHE